MRRLGLLLLFLLAALPVRAQDDEKPTAQLLDSIVRLRVEVPREARTAATLGLEREGSGVVIDSDGLIVTIGYLIMEATGVEVSTAGKAVPANVVGFDVESGLGLVRAVSPLGVKPIPLGRTKDVPEKSRVLVASYGGSENAIGSYLVSRRSFAGYWEYLLDDAIFTAPPHPHWAGAALLGSDGKLIGIGSLAVPHAAGEELPLPGNMFVPIDRLKPVLADLLSNGRPLTPPRPWLGVNVQEMQGRVVVIRVQTESPAEKAGVELGDIIDKLDGQPVADVADLYKKLWSKGIAGVEVPLTLLDRRGPREVKVKTMDRYKYLKLGVTY
jgi:S1-C subfamily serine protease